jgi:hypothetical protein
MTTEAQHTKTQYNALQEAYDHFNGALFGDTLPACLITLNRRPKSRGYFIGDNFASLILDGEKTSEIALNPDAFKGRTNKEILSTLAHEMAHLWQHVFGKPGRGGYHNTQWAAKMKEIGLAPSDSGQPGGKETGDHMTHYIVANGPFDTVTTAFLVRRGEAILWCSGEPSEEGQKRKAKSSASKTKFSCPDCEQAAWAKPTAKLMCGDCEILMVPENGEDDGEEGAD